MGNWPDSDGTLSMRLFSNCSPIEALLVVWAFQVASFRIRLEDRRVSTSRGHGRPAIGAVRVGWRQSRLLPAGEIPWPRHTEECHRKTRAEC